MSDSLRQIGVPVAGGDWSGRWLLRNVKRGDALLLHWPSFHYAHTDSHRVSWQRASKYIAFLVLLRLRGTRIGWIAHNLLPHEPSRPPWVDSFLRRFTVAVCNRVFVHGQANAGIVSKTYRQSRSKLSVIEHGHFTDLYPLAPPKPVARKELELPEDYIILLSFGTVQRYKGYEQIPSTLACLPRRDIFFLVAGAAPDSEYAAHLRTTCERWLPARHRLDFGYVDASDVPLYLSASDAMLVPYRDSLTSGTAHLAMSFGLPYVGPANPYLTEVLDSNSGVLYSESHGESLESAMNEFLSSQFDSRSIIERAKGQDWSSSSETIRNHLLR